MIKRMLLMLAAMTLLVGGVIGYKLFVRHMMGAAMAAQRPPPVAVSTAEAHELEWKPSLHAVGSFVAVQGLTVSAQLDGAVTQIAFEPGSEVQAGQLLVQQDISTETAELENAEAGEKLASISLDRAKQLLASGSNPQTDLDMATATFQQARATVAGIRTMIEKKTIRAPFAGHIGIRQISLGQNLRAGTPIASLQTVSPIFFNFTLPQQHASDVRPGQRVSVAVDAYPGIQFQGTVNAVNAGLDAATRTLQVQATLANDDRRLQPGMFGAADLELPIVEKVITLPLSAIVYNPYGNAVYVVENAKDGTGKIARQQFVRSGATRGDQVAILKGVNVGATVVTAGQLKLRSGASIVVNNSVVPSDSATPVLDHP